MPRRLLLVPNYRLRIEKNGFFYIDWTRNGKPMSRSCKTKDRMTADALLALYIKNGEALAAPFLIVDEPPLPKPLRAIPKVEKAPCVYLIGNAANVLVKIGKSSLGGANRLADLNTGSPVDLFLLHVEKCPTYAWASALETGLHWMFAERRVRGEWFSVTADEVRARMSDAVVILGNIVAPRVPKRLLEDS